MTTDQLLAELEAMLAARRKRKMGDYKVVQGGGVGLTDEQIFDIAEPFGAFELGDAQGGNTLAFARAILAAAPAVQGEPAGHANGQFAAVVEGPLTFTVQAYGRLPETGAKLYLAPQPAEKPAQSLASKLEAPATIDCWSCGAPVLLDDRADADGNCPYCSVELDLEEYLRATIAQPAPDVELKPDDLIIQRWSSKPLSQWDNSLEHGIKITHVPSGISITCDTERSVHANKERAFCDLEARLAGWKATDVSGLVEALGCLYDAIDSGIELTPNIMRKAESALAAYRKGGGQ